MGTMRLALCVAIMLLTLPQAGQAQDTFNTNSGTAPSKTWQERQGPWYANDPPSDEPAQGKGGGVLLKGGVSVEDEGTGPGGPGGGQRGGAGIFEGGTLPPRTGAGVFGPQAPAGPVLQGGTGTAAPGPGGAPVLKGGVSQGQQGAPGYAPPTASKQPASTQPVFVGSVRIGYRPQPKAPKVSSNYTIRAVGPPGSAGWAPFTNPERHYNGFYGQTERRDSGYVFVITKLKLLDDREKAVEDLDLGLKSIVVPVKKVQ